MLIQYLHLLKNGREGEADVKTTEGEMEKPSYWQLVFLQSKANGAVYSGEDLPGRNWDWPKDTYLQRRLHQAKYLQMPDSAKLN
jgi:hypothetical protein